MRGLVCFVSIVLGVGCSESTDERRDVVDAGSDPALDEPELDADTEPEDAALVDGENHTDDHTDAGADAAIDDAGAKDAASAADAAPEFDAGAPVSYAVDVAPILNDHCLVCHTSGGAGPFPLTSYDEAREHANEISSAVFSRFMPVCDQPYPACGLSDEQINTLRRWAVQRAPL